MKKTSGHKTLPWKKLLQDTFNLISQPRAGIAIFFLLTFLMSIPSPPDFEEWRSLGSIKLTLYACGGLFWLFLSYFVSVVLVLWVQHAVNHKKKSVWDMIQSANGLLIPLTILSIRGSILSVLGILAFVLPAFYFACKYELASLCLILEGWQDEHPPVKRAEEIISEYRFSLLPLALLLVVGWGGPWLLEWSLKFIAIENVALSRFIVALVEAVLTIFTTVYTTLATLHLLKGLSKNN